MIILESEGASFTKEVPGVCKFLLVLFYWMFLGRFALQWGELLFSKLCVDKEHFFFF